MSLPEDTFGGHHHAYVYVWDPVLQMAVPMTQPGAAVAGAGAAIYDGVSAAIAATVKAYANSHPLTVITVDTNGNPVSATSDASAANQLLGNASLVSIDGKITAVNTGAVTISAALPAGSNVIGHVIVDSSGVVHVIIDSSAALTTNATLSAETTKVIGTVNLPAGTVSTLTPPAAITGFALDSTVAKDTSLATLHTDLLALEADIEESHVTTGSTTAPVVLEMVGGKTSDATPQYQPLPLTDGGIAVPVRNSLLEVHGRLTNAFLGQALLASLAAVPNHVFVPIEIPSFLGGL